MFNLLQFLPNAWWVTRQGVQAGRYPEFTPVGEPQDSATQQDSDDWPRRWNSPPNHPTMKAVSVRQLQSDPAAVLRDAREQPVVVLNRRQPEALLVHLSDDSLLGELGVRLALAVALYKDESLSLGHAAEFSGLTVADFIGHVSRLGIPVARGANTVREDMEALDEWLGDDAASG